MAMVVRSNMNAMNANRNLSINNGQVAKSLEKLASGYAINRAGDDASGLAISEKMKAQIKGLEQASSNSQDGISLVQTAEGAMTEIHSMLNRMVELATKSANGTIQDDVDRDAIQSEVNALREEIDRIADATNFNGIDLLNGNLDAGYTVIKEETTSTQAVTVNVGDLSAGLSYGNITTEGKTASIEANSNGGLTQGNLTYNAGTFDASKGASGETITVEYVQGDDGSKGSVSATVTYTDSATFSVKIGDKTYDSSELSSSTTMTEDEFTKLVEDMLVESLANSGANVWDPAINGSSGTDFTDKNGAEITITNITGTGAWEPMYADQPSVVDSTTSMGTITSLSDLEKEVITITYQDADGQQQSATITFECTSSGVKATMDGVQVGGTLDTTNNVAASGEVKTQDAWIQGVLNEALGSELGFTATEGSSASSYLAGENGNILLGISSEKFNTTSAIDGSLSLTGFDDASLDKVTGMKHDVEFESGNFGISDISDGATFVIDGLTFKLDSAVDVTTGDGGTDTPITANSITALKDAMQAAMDNKDKNITFTVGSDGESISWEEKTLKTETKTVVETGAALSLQVGDTYDPYNNVSVSIESMKCDSLGIDTISVNDQDSAGAAIDTINDAINMVSTNRANLGALQNRLEYTINNLDNTAENMTSANSAIRDTDMASEMMEYTKMNVLVQSAQSMLAQANQAPQQILSLLG